MLLARLGTPGERVDYCPAGCCEPASGALECDPATSGLRPARLLPATPRSMPSGTLHVALDRARHRLRELPLVGRRHMGRGLRDTQLIELDPPTVER